MPGQWPTSSAHLRSGNPLCETLCFSGQGTSRKFFPCSILPFLWGYDANDALHGGCFPCSIPSQKAYDLPRVNFQGDPEEDMAQTIESVNSLNFKHHSIPK